jgi:hypothetical protein
VLVGLGLAVISTSCALKFTSWPAEKASGGAGSTSTGAGAGPASSTGSGPPPDCTTPVLAINALLLGDTDPDGTASSTAWKQYGTNIDGQVTTTDYSMHCLPSSNASASQVFPDGDNGIDNSFGRNIMPMLKAWSSNTFSTDVNSNITTGNIGYLFDIVGLMATKDQPTLTTRFYSGDPLAANPKFDGTDCWPVDGALVNDPTNVTTAKVVFTGGSLGNNYFTSGSPAVLPLTLKFGGYPITLTIHQALVQAALRGDHQATLVPGQISGVLDTQEFLVAVKEYARAHNLCGNAGLDGLLTQISQASDIMSDGTQDHGKVCDGISIGLGFTASAALLGGVGPASSPPAMPCP